MPYALTAPSTGCTPTLQSTKVDTVNRALAEIAARPRRLAALERLRTTADDLGDAEIMRGAWR